MLKNKSISACITSVAVLALILAGLILNFNNELSAWKVLYHTRRIPDFAYELDTRLTEDFSQKQLFVDLNGLANRLFLKREMNGVVLLNNGHSSQRMSDCSESNIIEKADALEQLMQYLEQRDTDMLYMMTPYKNEKGNSQLPSGVVDHSNEVADRFLSELDSRSIPYLDIRECIERDGLDYYSLFLKTEHHWAPCGGFYGFTKLCEYMADNYGDVIDPAMLDINNYNQQVLDKRSSGYYSTRTGIIFLRPEKFTLIYPKFETQQSCYILHKDLTRSGSFYDAVLDTSYMEQRGRVGLYTTYIGGDYPVVINHSESAKTDASILMFIDSFGTIPESFLTTVYKDVYAVDLRWVQRLGMEETALDFIEEFDPDHVVIVLNPNQILDDVQFEFGISENE